MSCPHRCFVAVCSECYGATFFFHENSSIRKFFLSASSERVGAGVPGNSLADGWIQPSALSYMGTWCPSVIPYASWWFPPEDPHNYFLLLNNPVIFLELGWKKSKSCVRTGGRAVLSFCGCREPDGFKENLKWVLKRSIHCFLCVSGYPVITVTSLHAEQWAATHCLWWNVTLFGVSREICQQNSVVFLGLR